MQPSELTDYLHAIADKLGQIAGIFEEGPLIRLEDDGQTAILHARLRFESGHGFRVLLTANGERGSPEWVDYRFHLMDAQDRCVFRYDNAPHHPDLDHFPHHKHAGSRERVTDHPEPSLAHVIEEVRRHVYPEAEQV